MKLHLRLNVLTPLFWLPFMVSAVAIQEKAIASPTVPQQIAQASPNTVTGRLDSNSQVHTYTFEGIVGETVVIEMSSQDFDTYLIVLPPDGHPIVQDDDGGDGTNSRIVLTLPATGTYRIYVSSFAPREMGQYSLRLQSRSGHSPQRVAIHPGISPPPSVLPATGLPAYTLDVGRDFSDPFSMTSILTDTIPATEQEVARLRQQLGDRHPQVAAMLTALAVAYQYQNRDRDAERAWAEALSIYQDNPQENLSEIADILAILANAASRRGQYSEAETLYEDAIAILQQSFNLPTSNVAEIFRDLGIIYQMQGRYDQAEALYTQALELYRPAADPLGLSFALNGLAYFYQVQGRYDQAEALYQEALDLHTNRLNAIAYALPHAETLTNLAILYHSQERYDEAQVLYQQTLHILQSSESFAPYFIPVMYNLAALYQDQGNDSAAIATLQTALDREQQEFESTLASLGEAERQLYVATVANAINSTVSLHVEGATNHSEAAELALTTLLRRKGRVLDANIRTLEILRQSTTPEIQSLLSQVDSLRQEIANLSARQIDAFSEQNQVRVTELTSRLNQLESLLARRSAAIAEERPPVDVNAVAAQIPQNGVLVEYIRYQPFDPSSPVNILFSNADNAGRFTTGFGAPRYAAYLLFPDGRIEAVDLGDAAEIDAAVESFTRLLQDQSADFQSRSIAIVPVNPERVEIITNNIRSLIYDPIANYLGDREHLLISPDSQLNLLPFEALQTEDGRYLVEQYQITYLNSGRDLLRLGEVAPSNAPAVILANPDYDSAAGSRDVGVGEVSSDLRQFRVEALPGTAREAEALRSILPGAEILTEQYATEQALKQVQSPSILHIATHGFFLADQAVLFADNSLSLSDNGSFRAFPNVNVAVENPLLRSGLAFAGFNQRISGTEDGIFTALEAANLNLMGTQLVVLSACDTGLGDIANGEGVYGLRRAFAIAGAEAQLMSLWQVSDDGTQNLMAQYYENLTSGMGRSEALREVQLAMIREDNEYSHPYYWAAFILAGDWRPINF